VQPSDSQLVEQARAGETGAFTVLVGRHYDACLRYATRMLGDRADAEDVVQETFWRAHRALPGYQDRQRFRAWLFRILANRCRSHGLRRAWRRMRLRLYGADLNGLHAREPAASAQLFTYDLQRLLDRLPGKLREAFLLKHVEELNYDEMAAITNASESALKMRVKRACAALESMLRDDAHDGP
jgi:RNA polymerase sigma-70 factor (ECF subfamily)